LCTWVLQTAKAVALENSLKLNKTYVAMEAIAKQGPVTEFMAKHKSFIFVSWFLFDGYLGDCTDKLQEMQHICKQKSIKLDLVEMW